MTITDLVLILFIAALLAFAIYDQFIMPAVTAHPAGNSFAPAWSHR